MAKCDRCGADEAMPYRCRHCGGTYCADHRLPENHDCPGLENWNDPSGVFDSGFDDSVQHEGGRSSGVASSLGIDTGRGGVLGYFRGNVTYLFLGLMWFTFVMQYVVALVIEPSAPAVQTWNTSELWQSIFVLSTEHPLYVWTWVTSIFAHGGIYHIAVNSIVIYFFGRLVEQYVGSKQFAALFLASGVLAGLGQILIQILLFGGGPAGVLGASGAGLAIMGVLTVLNPGLRVYLYFIFPVPLWLLTIGYTAFTVLAIVGGGIGASGTAQVAHLVGLALGLAYGERVKGRRRAPESLQFGPGGGGPGGGRGRGPF